MGVLEVRLESRECTGVRGGERSPAPEGKIWSVDVDVGGVAVARYTSLQAPSPSICLRPFAVVRMV